MNACLCRHALQSVRRRFERLYGPSLADRCTARFAALVGRYALEPRCAAPHVSWSERDAVLITYADGVSDGATPPLTALRRFLAAHAGGAFSTVHLLPFFPSSSDDGFSVVHFRTVDPVAGAWADVRALGEDHALMFDLVLNHASRRSNWFHDFDAGIAPACDYFITADPAADLSAVVRPRTHPLLTPVAAQGSIRHLWTTFSDDQLDLNYANPDLLFEILDILLFYVSQGARILRLDAVAYLWKRPGTPCVHLPETHEIVKLMRDLVDIAAPGTLLLTETNVPHAENISYFGDGDEAHLVYQFSLPPLLLLAFLDGDATALTRWAAHLAPPPAGCTFFNFTASHDGIGVRPLQGLADDHAIDRLAGHVRARGGQVSMKSNPDGSESPYELNTTWFDALGLPGDSPALHLARFLCSQIIALSLQGIPAVYLHSLTATPNDQEGFARTGRARTLNRKRWNTAELEELIADDTTPCATALRELTRVLRLRASCPAFHPDQPQQVLTLDPRLFVVQRGGPDGVLLIANVSSSPVPLPPVARDLRNLLSGLGVPPGDLPPCAALWLQRDKPAS
ncbi:MAG: sugar phosphorylase [Kiritimatiellia bacterium]